MSRSLAVTLTKIADRPIESDADDRPTRQTENLARRIVVTAAVAHKECHLLFNVGHLKTVVNTVEFVYVDIVYIYSQYCLHDAQSKQVTFNRWKQLFSDHERKHLQKGSTPTILLAARLGGTARTIVSCRWFCLVHCRLQGNN